MKYNYDTYLQEPKPRKKARLKQCNKSNHLARRYWTAKLKPVLGK